MIVSLVQNKILDGQNGVEILLVTLGRALKSFSLTTGKTAQIVGFL